MTKSFFLSIAFILGFALVESAILSNIYILPVIPDLVLIASIYFSLLNGRTFGELSGFVSGTIMDFITGVPFGLNCIYRTIVGYIYGFFSKHIVLNGVVVPVLTVATGTLLKAFLIWVISLFFTSINAISIFSFDFLFELIFNSVLAPFIFLFLSFFRKSLSIDPENTGRTI